jgi:hypothetical protein
MEEYDKFQESQTSMGTRQEEWIKQVKHFEVKSQKILADTQVEFENKLKAKAVEIGRVFKKYFKYLVARRYAGRLERVC